MAEIVLLEVEKREGQGTRSAQRLRARGLIPAVVYGHKQETLNVAVNGDAFRAVMRHGARIVDLKTGGQPEGALIQEVQWDHLGKEILHVDFRRVSKDEKIVVPVPIQLRGIAPGIAAGGVLDQQLHVLEIECLPLAVPESIRVNVGELQIGAILHVKDVALPPGVVAMDDAEAIVVQVLAPKAETEATEAAAGEQAEPEVIGRAKTEENAEEEK